MTLSDTVNDTIKNTLITTLVTYSVEKIKEFAKRFKDRDIAFIEDPNTISFIKEQRKSSEWQIYKHYLENKEFRILAQMGLTLRKLDNKPEAQQSLRTKIHDKYGKIGLHRAQLVQNEILNTIIAKVAPQAKPEELVKTIQQLLDQVDSCVLFIQMNDDPQTKIEELKTRMYVLCLPVIILYGLKSAKVIVTEIANALEKYFTIDYDIFREDSMNKTTICFRRKI